jgi:hypothetical protein
VPGSGAIIPYFYLTDDRIASHEMRLRLRPPKKALEAEDLRSGVKRTFKRRPNVCRYQVRCRKYNAGCEDQGQTVPGPSIGNIAGNLEISNLKVTP